MATRIKGHSWVNKASTTAKSSTTSQWHIGTKVLSVLDGREGGREGVSNGKEMHLSFWDVWKGTGKKQLKHKHKLCFKSSLSPSTNLSKICLCTVLFYIQIFQIHKIFYWLFFKFKQDFLTHFKYAKLSYMLLYAHLFSYIWINMQWQMWSCLLVFPALLIKSILTTPTQYWRHSWIFFYTNKLFIHI